tara:strand:+ start:3325 stop:3984 length:660 start_codon:yes stop_codon:yes gene_type:complete
MVVLVVVLGACSRSFDTQELESDELDSTADESVRVEEQRPVMTDGELIELLDNLDAGNVEAVEVGQYRGARFPSQAFENWLQNRSSADSSYGSLVGVVPRYSSDKRGALYVGFMPDLVAVFYSSGQGTESFLSDWMVVEKEQVHIMMLEVVRVPNLAAPDRVERSDYRYGLVHFDFETDPLVYEEWFRPDVVIEIDPDTGTLERLDEFPADWYVRVDGT